MQSVHSIEFLLLPNKFIETNYFMSNHSHRMYHPSVLLMVVDVAKASETFSLHSSPHNPQRISHYITEQTTDSCTYRKEFERLFIPFIPFMHFCLYSFIDGEVNGMKHWNRHYRYRVAYILGRFVLTSIQSFNSFLSNDLTH